MLNSIKIPIYGEKPEGGYYFQIYFSNIFLRNNLQVKKWFVPLQRFKRKALLNRSSGEVAEWSIAAVLKTVVLRGTRGSNPCLSAIKGVNQAFARFTPFFTPKNVKLGVFVFFKILQKNVNYKAIGISMDWQNEPLWRKI